MTSLFPVLSTTARSSWYQHQPPLSLNVTMVPRTASLPAGGMAVGGAHAVIPPVPPLAPAVPPPLPAVLPPVPAVPPPRPPAPLAPPRPAVPVVPALPAAPPLPVVPPAP